MKTVGTSFSLIKLIFLNNRGLQYPLYKQTSKKDLFVSTLIMDMYISGPTFIKCKSHCVGR